MLILHIKYQILYTSFSTYFPANTPNLSTPPPALSSLHHSTLPIALSSTPKLSAIFLKYFAFRSCILLLNQGICL